MGSCNLYTVNTTRTSSEYGLKGAYSRS